MANKANFDYNANYYRDYLNYETENMSRNLNELVSQALETATTEARGAAIRSCAVVAAYACVDATGKMLDNLTTLHNEALIYYQIILNELSNMNVFVEDFEVFYYYFTVRMEESYERLNDVLLQDVLDSLIDILDASRLIFDNLDSCLNAV